MKFSKKSARLTIIFRTDSSVYIGSGHVMRCLTLAEGLKEKGHNIVFICRERPGNLIKMIENKGFKVQRFPYDSSDNDFEIGGPIEDEVNLLRSFIQSENYSQKSLFFIVDHYGIDIVWERAIRQYVDKIMVIDDLANRDHDCDYLLDQNYTNELHKYNKLVAGFCTKLIGPKFALLRPEFRKSREKIYNRKAQFDIRKVMVFFGGSDSLNATALALKALETIGGFEPEVVVGRSNPHISELRSIISKIPGARLHVQINNIAEVMENCSWYFGAGGSVTWECMAVGLPLVVISTAENQIKFINQLASDGFLLYLGDFGSLSPADVVDKIRKIIQKSADLFQMSEKIKTLVTGRGLQNVIRSIGL